MRSLIIVILVCLVAPSAIAQKKTASHIPGKTYTSSKQKLKPRVRRTRRRRRKQARVIKKKQHQLKTQLQRQRVKKQKPAAQPVTRPKKTTPTRGCNERCKEARRMRLWWIRSILRNDPDLYHQRIK